MGKEKRLEQLAPCGRQVPPLPRTVRRGRRTVRQRLRRGVSYLHSGATLRARRIIRLQEKNMAKEIKINSDEPLLRLVCPKCEARWYTSYIPNYCIECGELVTIHIIHERPLKS